VSAGSPRPDGRVLALVVTQARPEDRAIMEALRRRGARFEVIIDSCLGGRLDLQPPPYAAVLMRSLSYIRSLYVCRYYESFGIPTINRRSVIEVCGDKIMTSLALIEHRVPTMPTAMALGTSAALEVIESMGYPVVLKPVIGSWGRLLARVDDRTAAESFLEHKAALAAPHHSVIYVQKYVQKPGRDIRSVVIGDRVIGAIYRYSEHWITNTARGAEARDCAIYPELEDVSLRAGAAVGGGALAIDLIETADGLQVTEVNHSMEFRNMVRVNGIEYADRLVDYVEEQLGTKCVPA
jgi:[lysine-biosynthesis-protein LysW]---L-2-aminoadipate ligase